MDRKDLAEQGQCFSGCDPLDSSDWPDKTDSGDAGIFAALRPDLLRFAFWLSGDSSVAEDVIREALRHAWRSRDSLRDEASVRAWLFTIVRREHARLYRRKRWELAPALEAASSCDCATTPGDRKRTCA